MDYDGIGAGGNLPASFNIVIEMSAFGKPVKYEADPRSSRLRVETFMMTSMRYPANYGFVPGTLAPDGRPVDVLVVAPLPIVPGAVAEAQALGTMHLTNERGLDVKIVAVPVNDVCASSADILVLDDLPRLFLHEFRHFFFNYQVLEQGKWSRFEHWGSADDAASELLQSVSACREAAGR